MKTFFTFYCSIVLFFLLFPVSPACGKEVKDMRIAILKWDLNENTRKGPSHFKSIAESAGCKTVDLLSLENLPIKLTIQSYDIIVVPGAFDFPLQAIDPVENFAHNGGHVIISGGYENKCWFDPSSKTWKRYSLDRYTEGEAPAIYFLHAMQKAGKEAEYFAISCSDAEENVISSEVAIGKVRSYRYTNPWGVRLVGKDAAKRRSDPLVLSREVFYYNKIIPLLVYKNKEDENVGPHTVLARLHNAIFENVSVVFTDFDRELALDEKHEIEIFKLILNSIYSRLKGEHEPEYYKAIWKLQKEFANLKGTYMDALFSLRIRFSNPARSEEDIKKFRQNEKFFFDILKDFTENRNNETEEGKNKRDEIASSAKKLARYFRGMADSEAKSSAASKPRWIEKAQKNCGKSPIILGKTNTPVGNSLTVINSGRIAASHGLTEMKPFTSVLSNVPPRGFVNKLEEDDDIRFVNSQMTKYSKDTGLRCMLHFHSAPMPEKLLEKFGYQKNYEVEIQTRKKEKSSDRFTNHFFSPIYETKEYMDYLRFLAKQTKNQYVSKYIEAIHEMHPKAYHGYTDFMFARYRRWLKDRFKNMSNLNSAWGSGYNSFDEISPPMKFPETRLERANFYDWARFRADMVCRYQRMFKDIMREVNPDARLVSGVNQAGPLSGIDGYRLFKELDFAGRHYTPVDRGVWYDIGLGAPTGFAFNTEYKPWGMPHFGSWGGTSEQDQSRRMRLDTLYQAINGMRGFLCYPWWWRGKSPKREILIEKDGYPYLAFKEFSALKKRSQSWDFVYEIGENIREFTGIAVYFPYETAVHGLSGVSDRYGMWYQIMRFMMREIDYLMEGLGFQYSVIDHTKINDVSLDDFQLIIVPQAIYMEENAMKLLLEYVKNGGNLWLDGHCALYNEYGREDNRFFKKFGIQVEVKKANKKSPHNHPEFLADLTFLKGNKQVNYMKERYHKGTISFFARPLTKYVVPYKTKIRDGAYAAIIEKMAGLKVYCPVKVYDPEIKISTWKVGNGQYVSFILSMNESKVKDVNLFFSSKVRNIYDLESDKSLDEYLNSSRDQIETNVFEADVRVIAYELKNPFLTIDTKQEEQRLDKAFRFEAPVSSVNMLPSDTDITEDIITESLIELGEFSFMMLPEARIPYWHLEVQEGASSRKRILIPYLNPVFYRFGDIWLTVNYENLPRYQEPGWESFDTFRIGLRKSAKNPLISQNLKTRKYELDVVEQYRITKKGMYVIDARNGTICGAYSPSSGANWILNIGDGSFEEKFKGIVEYTDSVPVRYTSNKILENSSDTFRAEQKPKDKQVTRLITIDSSGRMNLRYSFKTPSELKVCMDIVPGGYLDKSDYMEVDGTRIVLSKVKAKQTVAFGGEFIIGKASQDDQIKITAKMPGVVKVEHIDNWIRVTIILSEKKKNYGLEISF